MTMTTSRYFIAATALIVLTACAKEMVQQESNPQGKEYEFTAGFAGDTKTVVQPGGEVWWSPKEEINVFYGSQGQGKFTSTNTSPAAKTTFKGTFDTLDGTIEMGNEATSFWAVYPYDGTATCDGSSVTVSIPASQTAVAGSFGNNLFPSIAKSTNLSLSFWNLCGGVKFTVSQKGIKQVTFKGNNGERLAGTVKVKTDSDGRPYVYSASSSQTEVVVTAPDGGEFIPGTDYYVVTLPASLSKGYSIKFTKSALEGTFTSSNAQEIKRTVFGVLTEKDKDISYGPREGYITFVDESAKYACLDAFDTNKDNKLSYAEALAATSLSGVFDEYNGMSVFPELEYFSNVTDLAGAFKGCADLEQISIPSNITAIGKDAFTGCAKLTEITIPDTVTSIGDGAFDSNLDVAYMESATPPSIVSASFAANTDFFVPAESLNKYKLKTGWKDHAEHIFAIPSGANCFVISSYGSQLFLAKYKGNSTIDEVGEIASAEVLWESFGTDVTPNVGDVVSNVSYSNGIVKFKANADGNAVIAVKDASNNILWSWHIWVCKDFDPASTAQVYNNNAGTMMDRNLGATSATPGDVHALGLLYQWGRKDPFLSGSSISSGSIAASTLSWPSPVGSNLSNGTITYAVAHPTTFITYNDSNYDWYYTGSSSTDNTRWQTSDKEKGLYDPCPVGWRVPDGGSNGVWSKAFGTSSSWTTTSNWDSTNNGMNFGKTDKTLGTGNIWYPAAGYRNGGDGALGGVGSYGYYWSCTPDDYFAYCLYFSIGGSVSPSNGTYRADGFSVRCLSE